MYDILHTASFITIFIASLIGSLHCLGMCGGLVVLSGTQKPAPIIGQLQYHVGRGVSYVLIGFFASYFGQSLVSYFSNDSLNYLAPLSIVGVFLVAYTLKVRKPIAESLLNIGAGKKVSITSRLYALCARLPFALGFFSVFLPCGWLYSFVLLAAGSGGAMDGAKIMLAFWLGTLPVLLVAGTIFEGTIRNFSKKYTLLSLVLVTLAAAVSVSLRITAHHHGATPQTNIEGSFVLPERCVH